MIRDFDLCPDVDMVLRALGADPVVVSCRRSPSRNRPLQKGTGLLAPVSYTSLEVQEFRHERVRLVGAAVFQGRWSPSTYMPRALLWGPWAASGPPWRMPAPECFSVDP